MPSFWKRKPARGTRRLTLEVLEDRIVPDGTTVPLPGVTLPYALTDATGYNVLQPASPVNVLENDQNETGASWNNSTLTVVSAPQFGSLSLDPTTGIFLYTPNALPPPAPGFPPMPYPQDSFTYHVTNSLGNRTNTASVTLFPIAGPKVGFVLASPDSAITHSLQSVVINLLANDELRNDPTRPNDPGETSDWQFDFASVKIDMPEFNAPLHGVVTFHPATGAATYTPDFGYIGWDRFVYEVSTMPGSPDGPFPGEVFRSSDEVFVIINPAPPRLQPDPLGGQMLVIDGTLQNDTIVVERGAKAKDVVVWVNGVKSGPLRPTSRIVAFGYGGDDELKVAKNVKLPAWLHGGAGNDQIQAGGGPSVLLGDAGDDFLRGGVQRSLLFGGGGADFLFGKSNDDILVAGATQFDNSQDALNAVFQEWKSGRSYKQRVQNLTGQVNGSFAKRKNGAAFLNAATVPDDAAKDLLVGGSGNDLAFAAQVSDFFIDKRKGETLFVG